MPYFHVQPLSKMQTANSEDSDKMSNNAAFHQDLHCLLRQKQSSEKEIQSYAYHIKAEGRIH